MEVFIGHTCPTLQYHSTLRSLFSSIPSRFYEFTLIRSTYSHRRLHLFILPLSTSPTAPSHARTPIISIPRRSICALTVYGSGLMPSNKTISIHLISGAYHRRDTLLRIQRLDPTMTLRVLTGKHMSNTIESAMQRQRASWNLYRPPASSYGTEASELPAKIQSFLHMT